MKGHAKSEGCLRSEPKIGALDHETCALFCPVRLELLKQQLAQLCAFPIVAREKIMGPGQSDEPGVKSFPTSLARSPFSDCAAIDWTVARVFFTR